MDISGAWTGQLRPRGGQSQGELVPGDYLDLPEGLSDSASITRTGTIRFKPGKLTVRFTPAEGEVKVNNNEPEIEYSGTWERLHPAPTYDDFLSDIEKTTEKKTPSRSWTSSARRWPTSVAASRI
ncbi:hypothetical protein [Nonomuraea salmonea]|uniref:hypothetical protein n=1 Tax=Nonomuraea salmonea TaxID=46181 RepID=UPI002FE875B6